MQTSHESIVKSIIRECFGLNIVALTSLPGTRPSADIDMIDGMNTIREHVNILIRL
jgi:hypothetical protein